eukprot:IDg2094t1
MRKKKTLCASECAFWPRLRSLDFSANMYCNWFGLGGAMYTDLSSVVGANVRWLPNVAAVVYSFCVATNINAHSLYSGYILYIT